MTYDQMVRLAQTMDRDTSFFIEAWPRDDGLYDLTIEVCFPNRNRVKLYRMAVQEKTFAPIRLFPSAKMAVHAPKGKVSAS